MNDRYKKLFSNAMILAIGTFASKILVFLMMPLYTSYLMPEEYSVADLISQSANLLMPLVCVGLTEGIFRFTLDGEAERKKTLSSGLFVMLLTSAIFVALSPVMALVKEFNGYVWLVLAYVLAANIHAAEAQYVRACGNTTLFAVAGILGTALTIGFNILFLVVFHMGVLGYVLSVIVGDVIVSIFLFIFAKLWRDIGIKHICRTKIRSMLRYSIPMIPTTIFWWLTSVSDRYILTYIKGSDVNGLYAAAYKIPTILTLLCAVFIEAWQFSAVNEADEKERSDFFTRVFAGFEGIIFMATSAMILFSKLATKILFAESYYDSWQYIPVLAIATAYSALVTFMGSVYFVHKKSLMSFLTAAVGALTNIVLNIILIPRYSAIGAAVATFFSYFAVMIIRTVNTRRFVNFKINVPLLCFNTVVVIVQSFVMMYEVRYWVLVEAILLCAICFVNGKGIVGGVLMALKNRTKRSAEEKNQKN